MDEKTLQEVHDLGNVDFDGGPRVRALIATKLEEALLWTKRAMELAS